MSSSTTSNSLARTSAIVSSPVAASPATCMSTWSEMNCFRPARTIAWSSAIRMRIMRRVRRWLRVRAAAPWIAGRLVRGKTIVERLEAHAEQFRALAACCRGNGRASHRSRWRSISASGVPMTNSSRAPRASGHGERAQVQFDDVVGEDERSVHGVAQFTHVARPAVLADRLLRRAREALVGTSFRVELAQEMLGQQLGVAVAVAQRRQRGSETPPTGTAGPRAAWPSRTAACGSRLVAATMRASAAISWSPPMRWKRPVSSTRSRRTCISGAISVISSRNSVPPRGALETALRAGGSRR